MEKGTEPVKSSARTGRQKEKRAAKDKRASLGEHIERPPDFSDRIKSKKTAAAWRKGPHPTKAARVEVNRSGARIQSVCFWLIRPASDV
jgi:hypothetical protein